MLSVVIVTYDSAACVARCIEAVQVMLSAADVIVVDNESRNDTLSLVAAASPHARGIRTGDNLGFGRGCNAGAEAAVGSHLLFLNPDVVVTAVQRDQLDSLLAN